MAKKEGRRGFTTYTPVGEAAAAVRGRMSHAPRIVEVSPKDAFGLVAAETVMAPGPIPPMPTSHMDGYAVSSSDTLEASPEGPLRLRVIGTLKPGKPPGSLPGKKQAFRVFTGSFLPEGADSVVPVEETVGDGRTVELRRPASRGSFVYPRGADLAEGDVVLQGGLRIRAQDVGLAIASGIPSVKTYAMPRAAVLATGSELTESMRPVRGKVRNSHAPVFLRLLRESGCTPVYAGIAPDDRRSMVGKLKRALISSDVVLTTGGTSVGAHDLAEDVIGGLKPEVLVHGVKMDRGRVAGAAVVGGKPVIMLPGPIQGAMNAFLLLALPAIRALTGESGRIPRLPATMGGSWEARKRYSDFVKVVYVRLALRDRGFFAEPVSGETESMGVLSRSDGVVIVPEDRKELSEGEKVEVELIPGFSRLPR